MSPDAAWKTLGIACTNDVRAIRTAYARALKAIDVDADPKAFIVLRTAFELATALAKGEQAAAPLPPVLAEAAEWAERPGRVPLDSDWQAETPPPADPREQAFAAIEDEIFDRSGSLDTGRLRAAVEVLVAPAAIERLDVALDTEARLLEIIRIGYPRVEPLIAPALRAFGWDKREFPSDDVKWALALHRDTIFLERHPELEPAYRALQAPFRPPSRFRERMLADSIERLFDCADARWPHLAEELDPGAWQWWQQRRGRARLRVHHLGLSLGFGLALMVALSAFDFGTGAREGPMLLAAGSLTALGFALWRVVRRPRSGGFTLSELTWTLVSLLLPLAAVFDTPSPARLIGLGLVAGIATIFAGSRPEPILTADEGKRRIAGPILAVMAWMTLVVPTEIQMGAAGFIPISAAAITAWAVYPRAGLWIDGSSDRRWTAALAVACAGVMIGVALIVAGGPVAMAALALLLLAQHLLTGREQVTMLLHWQTWFTLGLAWFAGVQLIDAPPETAMLRTYALVVAAIAVYRSLRLVIRPS